MQQEKNWQIIQIMEVMFTQAVNQILLLTVHLICRKIEIHSIVLKARVLRHL